MSEPSDRAAAGVGRALAGHDLADGVDERDPLARVAQADPGLGGGHGGVVFEPDGAEVVVGVLPGERAQPVHHRALVPEAVHEPGGERGLGVVEPAGFDDPVEVGEGDGARGGDGGAERPAHAVDEVLVLLAVLGRELAVREALGGALVRPGADHLGLDAELVERAGEERDGEVEAVQLERRLGRGEDGVGGGCEVVGRLAEPVRAAGGDERLPARAVGVERAADLRQHGPRGADALGLEPHGLDPVVGRRFAEGFGHVAQREPFAPDERADGVERGDFGDEASEVEFEDGVARDGRRRLAADEQHRDEEEQEEEGGERAEERREEVEQEALHAGGGREEEGAKLRASDIAGAATARFAAHSAAPESSA